MDLDDDNDGLVDTIDDEPLIVETTAPEFESLEAVTFEASGVLTIVSLVEPSVNDANNVEVSMTPDVSAGLPIGSHLVTWRAVDFAGNLSTAEQVFIIQDTTAPVIDVVDHMQFNSTGDLTDVSLLLSATAVDLVDGEV